jgi:hypothetical protein
MVFFRVQAGLNTPFVPKHRSKEVERTSKQKAGG